MADPTSKELMSLGKNVLNKQNIKFQYKGTYLAINGPQFSTKAESNLYREWKCDVIGMTNMPEAKLCREAEIRYCSISMVTDYDCWHSEHETVDIEMVIKTMQENILKSKNFIKNVSLEYYKGIDFSSDNTHNILDNSIVTNKNNWDKSIKKKLRNILKRYIKEN